MFHQANPPQAWSRLCQTNSQQAYHNALSNNPQHTILNKLATMLCQTNPEQTWNDLSNKSSTSLQ
jgi:hypothetical protein